ncbi:hypothetical protein ABI_02990 [Asticcacaulis biprosthecium C19]|uniref:Transmembrane protein n=1 Tax=Asticcacaulis biprosthecium C19 TaxID=715226 RepID=F4QJ36_9CAUL|nr:hypothetical protein [Asticcacaulis biprosthecium]EGF91867.1 hypothetical protein ABI_02990 [Asticcacaulis biprosthecium C19]
MSEAPDDMTNPDFQNLWQSQPKEMTVMSLDQVHTRARAFKSQIQWRNRLEHAASALVVVVFSGYAIFLDPPLMRLGSILIVAATLLVSLILVVRGRAAPVSDGAEDCLDFHRRALIRQRNLLSSAWLWYVMPFVPGFVLFMIPAIQNSAGDKGVTVWIYLGIALVFFGGVIAVNLLGARGLQKEIDRLEG